MRLLLQDIAVWGAGGTPLRQNKDYFKGNIPWVKTGELGPKYIYDTEEKITESAIENSSAKIFPVGSVAIAMYGATIGKTSIFQVNAATNQACAVAQPYDLCNNEFLYYFLVANQSKFVAMGTGGAQPNISQTIIKQYPINLPSLPEQKRIVAKIESLFSRLDSAKDSLVRVRQEIKRYRQSVLKSAFEGKLVSTSKKKVDLLGNLAKVKGGKRVPKGTRVQDEKTKFPYIRVTDFKEYGVDTERLKYVTLETFQKISRYIINQNDVFISIAGTIGSVGMIPKCLDGTNLTENAAKITEVERLEPRFLMYYLSSPKIQRLINKLKKSTSQSKLALYRIQTIEVEYPENKKEQSKIVQAIESRFERAKMLEDTVAQGLEKIEQLKQSILKKAFEGKLVEPDPNDLPAPRPGK